jgi:hypothetical protein
VARPRDVHDLGNVLRVVVVVVVVVVIVVVHEFHLLSMIVCDVMTRARVPRRM